MSSVARRRSGMNRTHRRSAGGVEADRGHAIRRAAPTTRTRRGAPAAALSGWPSIVVAIWSSVVDRSSGGAGERRLPRPRRPRPPSPRPTSRARASSGIGVVHRRSARRRRRAAAPSAGSRPASSPATNRFDSIGGQLAVALAVDAQLDRAVGPPTGLDRRRGARGPARARGSRSRRRGWRRRGHLDGDARDRRVGAPAPSHHVAHQPSARRRRPTVGSASTTRPATARSAVVGSLSPLPVRTQTTGASRGSSSPAAAALRDARDARGRGRLAEHALQLARGRGRRRGSRRR